MESKLLSNKEHDFSDRKFRRTLNTTIINNFLKVVSNCSNLSSFFHHMRNSFKEIPHIFVSQDEDKTSLAFTEWLIMWLLTILSNQSIKVIHSECQDLLVSLLRLTKMSGSNDFRRIVLRFLTLLTDLNCFIEKFIENGSGVFTIKNFFLSEELKSIKEDEELDLVDTVITFSTPTECENLQERATSVLTVLMPDISQFLSDQSDMFCKVLCSQIESGDLVLKRESLSAVTSLIQTGAFMLSTCQVSYIFSCLQAMIQLCCSIQEPLPQNLDLIEHTIASCLNAVVNAVETPELKYTVNSFTLRKFQLDMMNVLFLHRFMKTVPEFSNSIVSNVIYLIKFGDDRGFPVPNNFLQDFKAKLSQLFLQDEHPKILVPLLVYLILTEHTTNLQNFCASSTEKQDSVQSIMHGSKTFCLLYNTLIKLVKCQGVVSKSTNFSIVCSCNEILLRSFIEIQNLNKKEFQVIYFSEVLFPELLLPPKVLDYLCFHVKQGLCSRPDLFVMYEEFVDLCERMLTSQDILSLSVQQLKTICNLISLPWFYNLKDADVQDLYCDYISPPFVMRLEKSFPVDIQVRCFRSLCYLPRNVSPQWRQRVFTTCLCSSEVKLRMSAFRLVPLCALLSVPPILNLEDLKQIILKEDSIEVLQEVAWLVGRLSCIFGPSCALYRRRKMDGFLELIPEVFCQACSKKHISNGENSDCFNKDTDANLSEIFIHVLSHPSASVRKEAVTSIACYFCHNEMTESLQLSVMNLVTDSNAVVRTRLSRVIGSILKPCYLSHKRRSWLPEMEEVLILRLKAVLLSSKSSGNTDLQKTVVTSIGEIGKVADNGLLLIVLISLLESYVTSMPSIKIVARAKLKEIASSKNHKMHELFKIYKEPICKFLAETMTACSSQDINKSLSAIEETGAVFGYGDIKSFINQAQRYILPYLICKETDQSSVLLTCLAKILHVEKSDLLIKNFSFIFSYFVCNCTKAELERALLFIQKETDLELGSLLRCNYQPIHNELLLQLSTHYDQVFNGLAILALKSTTTTTIITHSQDMANYLQPKLLGFLVFFDAQMLKSTLEEKKLALQSLVSIMRLMGSRAITSVRFKLMATLRIALRFKDGNFPKICAEAWNTFVHSIDSICLGPLLNQIIVALLPLLALEPATVKEIMRYLIIEKRMYLSEFFHDLYFVPDIPELQEINAVLKEYNESPSSVADFHSLLCHSLKGVSHENLEVRLHALEKLRQVLHSNQLSIREHLLGREDVDNLLSNLVAALIAGCREPDVRIRILLGECLGELGAIDPGRLDMKSAGSKEALADFYSSIEDEDFAFALIQELVHSFLAADECRVQDCSACAIQEVLRIYKCTNEKGNGSQLWKRFPPDIQEILAVLFHSQYKPLQKYQKKFPVPIYQSKMGRSFKEWTKNWFYSLLQKVKREVPFKLFHSCSIIIKYDLNCTLFLIPHLVVYALADAVPHEAQEICSEILAVLTHSDQSQSLSDLCHLSSQTAFSVFDHLTKWTHHKLKTLASDATARSSVGVVLRASQEPGFEAVSRCLCQIPQLLLANSAFACKAYTRALMHLEQHIREQPGELENNISFLQKIYAALDEPDGVAGVAAIRREEASLMDLILENEAMGDMQAAFACYEKAIKLYPDEVSYYGGLLKCFMGMDQPTTALTYANGVLNERSEWKDNLNSYRIEAAWKLASWQGLELYLQEEDQSSKWAVGVGNILYHANKSGTEGYEDQVKIIRSCQMAPLSAASMEKGSYLRGYEYLTRMHMLTDLQQSVKLFFNLDEQVVSSPQAFSETLSTLTLRRLLVQSSPRYQEPILDLHRVLLKVGKKKNPEFSDLFDCEIANCWLQSAKLARKSGHQQRAYSCLLEAGTVTSPDFFMEKTKWHWSKGEKEQAIYCLQKGIQEHFPVDPCKSYHNMASKEQLMCAKAKLLLAVYSEESSIVETNVLMHMYREVMTLQPEWEESHFRFATYYDKVLTTIDKPETKAEISVNVVHNFGTSLKYGCKNVYHSLPRLLDIWFDLGTQVTQFQTSKKTSAYKTIMACLDKLSNNVIRELHGKLPLYLFLTAMPQMVSRICHSYPDISAQLQKIIAKLIAHYSQQSMWMMMAVSKSSYPMRSKRCKQILQEAIALNPPLARFIHDTTRLADRLIELSNKTVGDCSVLSVQDHFPVLPRLFQDSFSQIILPLQSQMIVTLPNGFLSNFDHKPFPLAPVYIQGFQDTVEVFPSLQKPKKLVVKGSDGKLYPIMCKPKDDLRKDCRLMEFNNLVNRYLRSDPEARRRQLKIRTYAVVPLNEECGLIEWVPNLFGLRFILCQLYQLKGLQVTGREIRAIMPPKMATFEQKLSCFKNKFLPKFPPVFHNWFLISFPDPTAWYLARLAYCRTTAVMSMVGYIVGLGDRHGENILFDASAGDTVHVDLNCLFNKGETMECPECVPFRLTHNMVDAMGPSGFEGAFRKSCEVTMRVMRSKTDALMSVLRPFVHDPLVEWSRSKSSKAQPLETGEISNEQGLTHVKDIELRLNGIIKGKNKQRGLPLSIEGQVNHLIQEATDIKNLSQMYIGWAAYM